MCAWLDVCVVGKNGYRHTVNCIYIRPSSSARTELRAFSRRLHSRHLSPEEVCVCLLKHWTSLRESNTQMWDTFLTSCAFGNAQSLWFDVAVKYKTKLKNALGGEKKQKTTQMWCRPILIPTRLAWVAVRSLWLHTICTHKLQITCLIYSQVETEGCKLPAYSYNAKVVQCDSAMTRVPATNAVVFLTPSTHILEIGNIFAPICQPLGF